MKLNHTKEQIDTWTTAPLRLFESELVQDLKALHAEVERLTAELDKHRWIPVEERLPERPEANNTYACLIVLGGYVTLGYFCHDGRFYRASCPVAVTHWMPLPQPPEGTK